MRDTIVTLVALEADVMSRRTYPKRFPVHCKRSFPNTQMVARLHHSDRLRVGPAIVLRAAKQVQLAHGHREVRLFGDALENPMQDRRPNVGIYFHPARSSENLLHR